MDFIHRLAGAVAVVLLIASIITIGFYPVDNAGPFVIGFFMCVALYFKTSKLLSGFAYTVIILAAVSAALFYPGLFLGFGSFESKSLIVPLLMLIMFGMGTSMSAKDFVAVAKMPKGVIIGLVLQFSIMPIIGFGLALVSGLPPEIAAGIILVGCSPSGLASNVMAYIAGANLALSLTLTAVSTLMAPFITPFYMSFLANEFIPIDATAMFLSITKIVILPIIAGLLFNRFLHGKFPYIDRLMPKVSMFGIALIITIITAAGRDSLLSIGLLLIVLVLIHNLSGYVLGYASAKFMGMDEPSSRTIAFEVGMQNSGLASGIAVEMGKVATMGLAPAVFGPTMNITGSSLAVWWRGKTAADSSAQSQKV
ncbi:bile acid:sodium symporter family protein [Glaciecola sp. SC05]|uniref:bile acid:sodium symporter family protein n=1 Tax=Glaciecola sp. SC05 TaxID=1987355 RepID=UPI003526F019